MIATIFRCVSETTPVLNAQCTTEWWEMPACIFIGAAVYYTLKWFIFDIMLKR